MGRAKALLPWRGRPLIDHIAATLAEVVDEVVVVSTPALDLPKLDFKIVEDREPDLGPLAGIREGLHAVRSDLALITSTDSPFIDASFVERMLSFGTTAACVVDGHVQPLPAVYARDLATAADELLADGRRRPIDLLDASGFRRVEADEIGSVEAFRTFNTPREYLDAVRVAGADGRVTFVLRGRVHEIAGTKQLQAPPGTLREVLRRVAPELGICFDDAIAPGFTISIAGVGEVEDLDVPIGPDEQIVITLAPRDPSEPNAG